MTSKHEPDWSLVITPHREWWDINWGEIWRYRDLIRLFIRRDFVAYYKQTILGPLWFFVQPIFTILTMTVVFAKMAKISTGGEPPLLFYLSTIIAWNYFASCLTATSNTFITNAQIFGKVYFPRLCVPIAVVFSNMIQFAIQFSLYLLIWGYYGLVKGEVIHASWLILALPLLVLQMALLGLGCGILVSALTTRYRDLSLAVGIGVQLWFYATPIIYQLDKVTVPGYLQMIYLLNPMVGVTEFFRKALLGLGEWRLDHLAISLGVTLVILVIGMITFHRVEKSFTDTV